MQATAIHEFLKLIDKIIAQRHLVRPARHLQCHALVVHFHREADRSRTAFDHLTDAIEPLLVQRLQVELQPQP